MKITRTLEDHPTHKDIMTCSKRVTPMVGDTLVILHNGSTKKYVAVESPLKCTGCDLSFEDGIWCTIWTRKSAKRFCSPTYGVPGLRVVFKETEKLLEDL